MHDLGEILFSNPMEVGPLVLTSLQDILAPRPILCQQITSQFGSSKCRTSQQAIQALTATLSYLQATHNDIVIFTDGSALSNPGPCGAGAVIYWKGINSEPTCHTRAVAARSSSYHGELQAIDLALNTVQERQPEVTNQTLHILTDCQSAMHSILSMDTTGHYGYLLRQIQHSLKTLFFGSVTVKLAWTAGHINLRGNEQADAQAKKAAEEAALLTNNPYPASVSEVKTAIREGTVHKWQKRWDNTETAKWTRSLIAKVQVCKTQNVCDRKTEVKLCRLKTGATLLNDHMNKIMPDAYPTPNCSCEQGRATIDHFLTQCTLHNDFREVLLNDIELVFYTENAIPHLQVLNTETILGEHNFLSRRGNFRLQLAVAQYIKATETSI